MRLVWRKKYGFSLVAYPVESKKTGNWEEVGGFKAGIFDSGGDLWWFSEETVSTSAETEVLAYKGWEDLLKEFVESHNIFPDGTDPHDGELLAVDKEIGYAQKKQKSEEVTSIKEAIKEATGNANDDTSEEDPEENAPESGEEASTGRSPAKEGGAE